MRLSVLVTPPCPTAKVTRYMGIRLVTAASLPCASCDDCVVRIVIDWLGNGIAAGGFRWCKVEIVD